MGEPVQRYELRITAVGERSATQMQAIVAELRAMPAPAFDITSTVTPKIGA